MSQNPNTDSFNNPTTKGLITDLAPHLQTAEIWTYARNSVLNSHAGNMYALQNEQSNTFCVDLPYTYIGSIPLIDNRFAVFTTDNINSEIGIFDANACTYTTVVNDSCLGFNTGYLISGKSKYNFDCSETVYWADSGLNPRRYLNLQHVPYIDPGTNCDPNPTNRLDCPRLLLDPNINVPFLNATQINEGNLKNGVYQFAIAYSIDNLRITDIFSFTNPVSIFYYQNKKTRGINVKITDIDTATFDQYELIVAYTIDNVTTYKSLGFYSTDQTDVSIYSVDRPEYESIEPTEITVKKNVFEKADWCEGNDKYLLWGKLTQRPEIGYQPQAMKITSSYSIVEADYKYYDAGGENVGYYSDETYAFGIQWLRKDGSYTNVYHIPGTTTGSGVTYVNTDEQIEDVFEYNVNCRPDSLPPVWYVKNTAARTSVPNRDLGCNLYEVADGRMAYTANEVQQYNANDDMFPNDKCTPIRHHKFPSEAIESRFNTSNKKIRIKAIKFSNIEHPEDINGNPIPDIVGFRIVRSDRTGNRTVIAKGYSTNMRVFEERLDPKDSNSTLQNIIYYPNYPYNDLRPDPFLALYYTSSADLTVGGSESLQLSGVSYSKFTFYSPHVLFSQYALGNEIIFEKDESGTSKGYFDYVYDHAKFKIWNTPGVTFAALLGVISTMSDIISVALQMAGSSNGAGQGAAGIYLQIQAAFSILGTFVGKAVAVSDAYISIINNISPWQNYALQYNSYCKFDEHSYVRTYLDGRRRSLVNYNFLSDGLNPIQDVNVPSYINNYKKPLGAFLQINRDILPPIYTDASRDNFLVKAGEKEPGNSYTSTASLYYTAVKRRIPDQYGTLDSITYVNTGYEQKVTYTGQTYSTDIVYGGDCFINLMSVNQPQSFFSNYATNIPNGSVWDYRNYKNIAYPRFWLNSTPFSILDSITGAFSNIGQLFNMITNLGGTPSGYPQTINLSFVPESRIHLDSLTPTDIALSIANPVNIFRPIIQSDYPAYMYTSYNGVALFYVESDFNVGYRDFESNVSNVYTINSSLDWIFRSDNIFKQEEFLYDMSYSKQNTELFAKQQDLSFNLSSATYCAPYWPNSIIYSLPANQNSRNDHWLYYLPKNQYTFPLNDFGNLTSFHNIDNQQLIFLFDKAGPYLSIGRDMLETKNGITVTIGDAGLFEREPRPIEYTTYGFGSSTSRFAFKATAYGNYYPSQQGGKTFAQAGMKLDEISNRGNKYWFSEFLPSQLLKQFPNFKHKDNTVVGVGLISTYDPTYETFILTKKDYKAIVDGVTYDEVEDAFYYQGQQVYLDRDKSIFEDASWTISYKSDLGVYVSWHDYHPIGYLQNNRHFMSVNKDSDTKSSIWKHNEVYNSYVNFYNTNYPFGIQLPVNNQANVETIRSIEFFAETYVYKSQWDYFHVLDTTFDYAIISNSEQVSGWLHLNPIIRNQVGQQFLYPFYNVIANQYEIKIDKVENRYRFNQFWDITKDRGEYSGAQFNLISTQSNGYIFNLNLLGVDYNKPQTQRKKFRHKTSKVYLQRQISGNNKITLHFSDTKQTQSPR